MRPLDTLVQDTATRAARSRFAWRHPRTYLAAHSLVGLVLAAACAWAFIAIADAMAEAGRLSRTDVSTAAWLQHHGTEKGESIFVGVSWLGSEMLVPLVAVAAVILLRRRAWQRLALLLIASVGVWPLNMLLKIAFHRARPSFAIEFVTDGSFSFPSGHAMESIVIYGVVAFLLVERYPSRRTVVRIAWLSLAALIGFSRLYLGVHYISDVLAGFAAGFVWLFTCVTGYRFAERRRVGAE
jgi:membrane-associated phospholipid phosphatase